MSKTKKSKSNTANYEKAVKEFMQKVIARNPG
jgi:uncharacterized protein YaaR (DUF327 family)